MSRSSSSPVVSARMKAAIQTNSEEYGTSRRWRMRWKSAIEPARWAPARKVRATMSIHMPTVGWTSVVKTASQLAGVGMGTSGGS
ncbi:hypothetical protein D3C87_2013610 [compost metagenome]